MVKKRGGVPYLKTNLKFSWESATDLDNNELNEILLKLGSHLNEVGLSTQGNSDNVSSDLISKRNRKRKLSPSDCENEYGFVGLNSVFSGMSSGDAICVLFDSSSLKASAVSSVLGLYAHSCSPSTSSYAVPRLDEILSPILKRRGTEAIGLTDKSSSIIELIREKLVPLSLAGKGGERVTLGVSSTEVSVGKNPDRKRKNQKGRSNIQ